MIEFDILKIHLALYIDSFFPRDYLAINKKTCSSKLLVETLGLKRAQATLLFERCG